VPQEENIRTQENHRLQRNVKIARAIQNVLDYAVAERKSMEVDESLRGILLWLDIGTSIRPSNFDCLPADEIRRWRNMIRKKGINIPTGRDVKIKTVMIDLLTERDYPGDTQP
jgi:hypothetical protein